MLSIIIGLIGLVSIVIFLIFAQEYNFTTQEQTIVSLLLLLSTLLIEVLSLTSILYKKLKLIHPFLSLSDSSELEDYEIIRILKKIKNSSKNSTELIALHQFNKAKEALLNSVHKQDFHISDIVDTNKFLLSSLNKGHAFDGVSMLIEPDLWKYNGYLDLNVRQAKNGIKIRRIFVFDNKKQYELMKDVMNTLLKAKTKVFWCFKDELDFKNFYQDFTIIKSKEIGIYIPLQEISPIMRVTSAKNQIEGLESQFLKLLEHATEYKNIMN